MQVQTIKKRIHEIRDQKVLLDFDLAEFYNVPTKALKQAVKRNLKRFPDDFMFKLTKREFEILRSQIVTSKSGGVRYAPYAFTEQGVAMLSSIIKSPKAIEINIAIMRAFVFLRQYAFSHKEFADKLKKLERKFNKKFKGIDEAINYLLSKDLVSENQKRRKRIGFKE